MKNKIKKTERMLNLKKFLLFVVIVIATLDIHSQNADAQINALLAKGDFFKLKEEYLKLKEKSSETIQLFVEAYLGSYFNQPEQANENIRSIFQLYSQYPDFLTPELQISLFALMADNEAKLQNYKNATLIYLQIIEQFTPYLDAITLNSYKGMYRLYNSLQDVPQMKISYLGANATVPLKRDAVGLLLLPVNSSNRNTKLEFVMDFGAGFCMTEEKYAQNLGIKIVIDSIYVSTGVGTKEYSKIGIAEKIAIGDVKITNAVFILSPNKILSDLPDTLSNYEITGIIGFPVLAAFEHLTISDLQLIVSKSKIKSNYLPNMMRFGNELYVQAVSAKDTLFMQFDSGSGESLLTNRYLSNRNIDTENLAINSIGRVSYGGMKKISVYKKNDFLLQVGTKKMIFPSIYIYIEDFQHTSFSIDGIIGQDFLKQNNATIIDFKNMYIDFQ